MTRTIFSSDVNDVYSANDFEETRKFLAEEVLECPIEEVSDNRVYEELYQQQEFWYDDETHNLDVELPNNIIAIGTVGTWRGPFKAYKIVKGNLQNILDFYGCDDIKVYQKGKRVFWEGYHHDGSNYMEFRLIRDNVNIFNLTSRIYNQEEISKSTLNYYTKALGDEIDNIYGKQAKRK